MNRSTFRATLVLLAVVLTLIGAAADFIGSVHSGATEDYDASENVKSLGRPAQRPMVVCNENASRRADRGAIVSAMKQRLEEFETAMDRDSRARVRRWLESVHQDRVDEFTAREGFGMSRMPIYPSRELVAPAPLALAPVPESSSGDESSEAPLQVTLPETGSRKSPGELNWPSRGLLATFHETERLDFLIANPSSLAPESPSVVGLPPHRFRKVPGFEQTGANQPHPEPLGEKWLIRRLELVGLITHADPIVYVSENLPNMLELGAAETRALSPFERRAVDDMRRGEDLVYQATENRVRFIGSIRAARQCVDCHQTPRGQLLGAFSYELVRDPPRRLPRQLVN